MSGIGNYIHYSYANYKKYGTSVKTETSEKNIPLIISNYEKSFFSNDRLNKINSNLTAEQRKQIEETITAIMTNSKDKKVEISRQAIKDRMDKNFKGAVKNINWEKGSVATEAELQAAFNAIGKISMHHENGRKGRLSLDIHELIKKIDLLEKRLAVEVEKDSLSQNEANALITQIKSLYEKTYETIYNSEVLPNQKKLKTATFNNMSELRDTLNATIQEYASCPAIFAQEGALFEDMIAAAPYVAGNIAQNSVREMIDKNVVGDKSNLISQYNNTNFTKNVSRRFENGVLNTDINLREKVDVKIQWDNQPLNISAKNIKINNGYKWVNTVSGSPLLYMLQDLDSNFVNHYFNLFVSHKDRANISYQRDKMAETLERILFYKSITGDTFGQKDKANLMVINDKASGKVRVFDMKELVNSLLTKFKDIKGNTQTLYSIKTSAGKRIRSIFYKNEKVNEKENNLFYARMRIADVLSEAHNIKIFAAFNYTKAIQESQSTGVDK